MAQNTNKLFYAGNDGAEVFNDVVQLSNGDILVAGTADNLAWLPEGTATTLIDGSAIANNAGSNKQAFLMLLDSTLNNILHVVHLEANQAEDFRFIKTTNEPRTTTADMFVSGNTEDTNEGGYFIAKLNNNFVNGLPTAFTWVHNVQCKDGDYPKQYQPWDVDALGRVYYVRGDSHDFNWSAMYRLNVDGNRDVVENWRTHWITGAGEFRGTPASSYVEGVEALSESGIVFKKDGRCNLRSWTQADYDMVTVDGNGGWKKGKWPLDVLFNSPCNPAADSQSTAGPGYTGYSTPSGTITYGPSVVCIDRRTNNVYVGLNSKSVLPGGNPDFEPAVMAMDPTGDLLWWSRLYHELRPDSTTWNSTPDQYIDALAIDYSLALPNSELVVVARCHGNNVENFWEGNTIAANPSASGFQNQFTGTSGNIHISWLGKLNINNANLQHSTYVAEYANSPSGLGTAHPEPIMDGWPNPNAGWPTVNTTRLQKNVLKVTADGSVIVVGIGRRTMTTANAYQKMPQPAYGGTSTWNYFVRTYNADLSLPKYSSLVVGQWDTLTQQLSVNTELMNVFKLEKGLVVVGKHTGENNDVPISDVSTWGNATYNGESALIGYFEAVELIDAADSPISDVATPFNRIAAKLFLQGAYSTANTMTTNLGNENILPTTQPFNRPPWNYTGAETTTIALGDITDWVLIELRLATNTDLIVEQKAALLRNDGILLDVDGSEGVKCFNINTTDTYKLLIRTRNHLAVCSANDINIPQASLYDFTVLANVAGIDQVVEVGEENFALYAGDFNSDGLVTVADFNDYLPDSLSVNQYVDADCNMDTNVTIADFNLYQPNASIIGIDIVRY